MLQRTQSAAFLGGAYVFPGGALDSADAELRVLRRVRRPHRRAGERAPRPAGRPRLLGRRGARVLRGSRHAARARRRATVPIGAARAEALALNRKRSVPRPAREARTSSSRRTSVAYYGHWITAPGRPRRFDTRFFVAARREGQQGSHDAAETVHHVWITAARGARARRARRDRAGPRHAAHAAATWRASPSRARRFEYARDQPDIEVNRACWAQGKDGPKLFRRADPPYFEIHWSDPRGDRRRRTYDIVPGVPKRLDRCVTRLIAPNPGVMTGPGHQHLSGRRAGRSR